MPTFGDFTLKLLPTREHHCARGLHHFGIGTGKGFKTRGGGSIGTTVVTLKLGQIVQILTQCLVKFIVWQYACVGIEHFAVTLALALINLRKRRVVQHAILTVATLHLQRRVGHRFTTPGINKRSAVNQRRLIAKRIQALPGLPCQHQQG
ncbi:Uncharacterised protein [Shigella sonnei]|nr:Uncharacterised protein [Shigella sonnei]